MENLHLNVCLGPVQLMLSRSMKLNMSSCISIILCQSVNVISCNNAYIGSFDSSNTIDNFIGECFYLRVSGNKDKVLPWVFRFA